METVTLRLSALRASLLSRSLTEETIQEILREAAVTPASPATPVASSTVRLGTPWSGRLTDEEVVALYPRLKALVDSVRALASYCGAASSVKLWHWIRAGVTLKGTVPNLGPCFRGFSYLQNWDFPDPPTEDCLVWMTPRLLPGSTSKSVDDQKILLRQAAERYQIPAAYLENFLPASVMATCILGHYQDTQKRVPLQKFWARTATVLAGGSRLDLGAFDKSGLYCRAWYWHGGPSSSVGVLPNGVVTLGHSDPRPWLVAS